MKIREIIRVYCTKTYKHEYTVRQNKEHYIRTAVTGILTAVIIRTSPTYCTYETSGSWTMRMEKGRFIYFLLFT